MDQDRADGYGVQRRAGAWVWPLEARRTDAGDIELRVSDPRDLEPYVRRAEGDPDRPWHPSAPDLRLMRELILQLAPSLDRTQAFGTAGELLRRLAP